MQNGSGFCKKNNGRNQSENSISHSNPALVEEPTPAEEPKPEEEASKENSEKEEYRADNSNDENLQT